MNSLRTLELIRFGQMLAAGDVDADEFESADLSELCRRMVKKEGGAVWKAASELFGGRSKDGERLAEFIGRRLSEDVEHVRKAKRLQRELFSHQLHVEEKR